MVEMSTVRNLWSKIYRNPRFREFLQANFWVKQRYGNQRHVGQRYGGLGVLLSTGLNNFNLYDIKCLWIKYHQMFKRQKCTKIQFYDKSWVLFTITISHVINWGFFFYYGLCNTFSRFFVFRAISSLSEAEIFFFEDTVVVWQNPFKIHS